MQPRTFSLSNRRLGHGHFAFMRGVVQGLDLRSSWDRYLSVEGEATDLRRVKSTIAWIRSEFAAAARRHSKPGTARLVVMDASDLPDAPTQPSLADFAAERGLEDFSEAEQLEAFIDAFGTPTHRNSRRSRLTKHQLEALVWLERLVAQDPGPEDSVHAWFPASLAKRLEQGGVRTLAELAMRINGIGSRWWTAVPGVGATKAARVVDWIRLHEGSIGRSIGAHVVVPRRKLEAGQLRQVVAPATALVPFEKFVLPAELDGRGGRYRAPAEQCMLEAPNDYAAIAAWLATKHDPAGKGQTATLRAYRKEAERLLLWAILERRKPLSSLSTEDANAFKAFLTAPPAAWCGPRYRERWSPLWRPLEGPLAPGALRQSLIILRGLFGFLVSQNYLIGNPFAGVALPREEGRALGSRRTLTFAQWDFIQAKLDEISVTTAGRRTARALRWLYATGLRVSEMASVRCGDLEKVSYRTTAGDEETGWLLHVVGKGQKTREVPVAEQLVDELVDELERHGLEPDPAVESNRGVAILASFEGGDRSGWSASGLATAVKTFLAKCADELDGENAERLRKASTHWLRHTHGSHALNGRPGQAPVPVQVVQNNLGHSSLATTSGYLTTERDARLAAMRGFGERK